MQPGEFIRENTPVATIVQVNPLKLRTGVQESYAGIIQPGQAVEFRVEAFGDRTFTGKVAYVSPALDQATRTFAVEALVDNADRRLKPGFFAKGVILTKRRRRRARRARRRGLDARRRLDGLRHRGRQDRGSSRSRSASARTSCGKSSTGLKGDETLAASRLNQLATGVSVDRHGRRRGAAAPAAAARRRRRTARPAGSDAMKLAEVSVNRPVFAIMMTRRAHRAGRGLVRLARPRPDAEDRRRRSSRAGQPAGRQRRGDRDPDHQARSRRRSTRSAASTSCAPPPTRATRASPSPSRSSATSSRRPRTCATSSRTIVGQFPRDTRPPSDQQDRSRRGADPDARRLSGRARRRS